MLKARREPESGPPKVKRAPGDRPARRISFLPDQARDYLSSGFLPSGFFFSGALPGG